MLCCFETLLCVVKACVLFLSFFTTWQVTRPSYKGNMKEISCILMNFNEDLKAKNINLIERTNKIQPCSRIYYSNVS